MKFLEKLSRRNFNHVVMYLDISSNYVEFDASWTKKHIRLSDVEDSGVENWLATVNLDEACRFTGEAAIRRASLMGGVNNSRGRYLAIYATDAVVYAVLNR